MHHSWPAHRLARDRLSPSSSTSPSLTVTVTATSLIGLGSFARLEATQLQGRVIGLGVDNANDLVHGVQVPLRVHIPRVEVATNDAPDLVQSIGILLDLSWALGLSTSPIQCDGQRAGFNFRHRVPLFLLVSQLRFPLVLCRRACA